MKSNGMQEEEGCSWSIVGGEGIGNEDGTADRMAMISSGRGQERGKVMC